jgi:16S rRNA U516 pseudouridylate synthase RsuA-like enzyme
MKPLTVDDAFLIQQNEWNTAELIKIAASVHDIRRRHADELMDDGDVSTNDTSSEIADSSDNDNQSL